MTNCIFGQNKKLDSLKQIIVENKRDTNQVKTFYRLASYNLRRDLDAARQYAENGHQLATEINYPKGIGIGFTYRANVLMDIGKTEEAEVLILESIKILEKVTDINVDASLASAYSILGHLENNKNNSDKAFSLYIKAAKLCENSTNKNAKQNAPIHYNNIAILYKNEEQYEKGLKYGLKALEIAQNNNANSLTQSVLISTVGRFYLALNELDKALTYFNQSLVLKKEIDDKTGIISLLASIGNLHFDKKEYAKAEEKYQEVVQRSRETNYVQGKILGNYDFAKLSYAQKKYNTAIRYAKNLLNIKTADGQAIIVDAYLKDVYEIIAKSHAALRQFELAYDYQLKHAAIQDTIAKQKQQENINELETKYEVEKKEQENKFLKSEQTKNETILQQRSYLIIGAVITIALLVFLASLLFRSNRLKQTYNEGLEIKVAERTAALKMANKNLEQANYELRTFNYIASHDIKEPIRNIGNYAGLVFRKLPEDLKSSLGSYFETIKRSTSQLYTLVEDFAKYTTLSKNESLEMREVDLNILVNTVKENLRTTIEATNGNIVVSSLPTILSNNSLLYAALKNLIENGLKYNQSPIPIVKISHHETEIHHQIIVSDNGIGIEKEYHDKIFEMFKRLHNRSKYEGSGIGLAIVKLVIEKLNGTVQVKNNSEKGSQFIITLDKGLN